MLALPLHERASPNRCIQEGDLVIVYEKHDRMKAVTVHRGAELQNRYGLFAHSDWIGKNFGSKVLGKSGGFVYLLAPTPELWTFVLSHRTQILYLADISFVISYLELRPGNLVLESGTGSGSLTTSLARAIAPTGHVYTFDFHEQRASSARQDFERNSLSGLVTVEVRDIQGLGFPIELAGKIDAVFLDLPQPWLVISSAARMLRCNGSLCSFSPCIEQVQQTCETLQNQDFTDVRTFEVLLRAYGVREESLMPLKQEGNPELTRSELSSPPHKKPCPDTGQDGSFNKFHSPEDLKAACQTNEVKTSITRRPGLIMAKPVSETRGHTGYLTFAVRAV